MDQDFKVQAFCNHITEGTRRGLKSMLSISKVSTTVMYDLKTAGIHQAFRHHFSFVGHTRIAR